MKSDRIMPVTSSLLDELYLTLAAIRVDLLGVAYVYLASSLTNTEAIASHQAAEWTVVRSEEREEERYGNA